MANTKQVMTAVVAGLILVSVFPAVSQSITDNTGVQSVGNESVTADVGNYTDLDGYNIKDGTVTVENDGTTYTEGDDYEIDYEAGELKALDSGTIEDGETLTVSYDYQASGKTTATIANLIPLVMALVGVMLFARYMDL